MLVYDVLTIHMILKHYKDLFSELYTDFQDSLRYNSRLQKELLDQVNSLSKYVNLVKKSNHTAQFKAHSVLESKKECFFATITQKLQLWRNFYKNQADKIKIRLQKEEGIRKLHLRNTLMIWNPFFYSNQFSKNDWIFSIHFQISGWIDFYRFQKSILKYKKCRENCDKEYMKKFNTHLCIIRENYYKNKLYFTNFISKFFRLKSFFIVNNQNPEYKKTLGFNLETNYCLGQNFLDYVTTVHNNSNRYFFMTLAFRNRIRLNIIAAELRNCYFETGYPLEEKIDRDVEYFYTNYFTEPYSARKTVFIKQNLQICKKKFAAYLLQNYSNYFIYQNVNSLLNQMDSCMNPTPDDCEFYLWYHCIQSYLYKVLNACYAQLLNKYQDMKIPTTEKSFIKAALLKVYFQRKLFLTNYWIKTISEITDTT